MTKIERNLFKFAVIPDWNGMLNYLEGIALPENWNYTNPHDRKNQKNPILENYIHHTFIRLVDERNELESDKQNLKICIVGDKACFNTGLFTRNYQYIYAYFEKNTRTTTPPWVLKGFYEESSDKLKHFNPLPMRAEYFGDISDLIYDTKLPIRINVNHILDDENNKERIPEQVRNIPILSSMFNGAIDHAQKRIEANYRVAVPQYYKGKIQFLIPIYLTNFENADLVLAVSRRGEFYTGNTCLTMDMAYNNARLIAKPDIDWLRL